MTHEPRSKDEIYKSIRDSLKGKITKITNFTETSFNYIWTRSIANEVQRLEILALVSEMSAFIDYSGGPITEEDLDDFGHPVDVDVEEVNELMEEEYLDELVKLIGVDRFEGSKATGSVTFQTQSNQTDIPEGTRVTTAPDSSGETIDFLTTERAETASGVTSVSDVSIEAVDVGTRFNVPADTIIRVADPPVGVLGVNNNASTTGGECRESNEDFRARAKRATQQSSGGGTVSGIIGQVQQNIDAVREGDVLLDEFTEQQPPYVDVIVDGGTDSEVTTVIDDSRPAGIKHNLVRPQIIQIRIDMDLLGTDIDTATVQSTIEDFLLNLGIDENYYEDEVIKQVMNSDEDIVNIDRLGASIDRVTNERFTYDNTQTDYRLDFTYESANGSVTVEDDDGNTYTEGVDYSIQDKTGDGWAETLVWDTSNTTPADGQNFSVDYDVTTSSTASSDVYTTNLVRDEALTFEEGVTDSFTYEQAQDLYELSFVPFDGSTSISDGSGNTYAEGADYEIVDDSGNGYPQTIDWTIGGSTPSNNEDFIVTYNKEVYHLTYEVRDTPSNKVQDASGDTYTEDTDYEIIDYSADDESDALRWLTNPASLADSEEFYLSYFNEGDIVVDTREKVDPSNVSVSVK